MLRIKCKESNPPVLFVVCKKEIITLFFFLKKLIYLFSPCNVMFSFQTILPGTQWFSCETTGESDCATVHRYSPICAVVSSAVLVSPRPEWVPSRHLHPDDSHRAVDLSLCCSQDPERGQSHLLQHSCLFPAMVIFMWQKMELTRVFCCFVNSALLLITPGTRWMELPAFSIATNTSPAGQVLGSKLCFAFDNRLRYDKVIQRAWTCLSSYFTHFCCIYRVSIKESSVAKLGSVCRRIYRIFSHAYFHHRQIFDKYEVGLLWVVFMAV